MKIDAHQHFWKYDPIRDAWIDDKMNAIQRDFMPEDLQPELENNGLAGCIAVQATESKAETRFLLDLAERHTWVKKVVGWIDLRSRKIEIELEAYSPEVKLAGFRKILQSLPPEEMEDRALLKGIGHLEKYGYTYDILIYPKHLEAVYHLVKKFPNQAFVLDHMAKPDIKNGEFKIWNKGIKQLASLPNVSCKVSGMVTEADWENWQKEDFKPYLDAVAESFGVERMMYGSDWPVCLLAGSYTQVHDLAMDYFQKFSPAEQQMVFGENACRFYGV
ncbi:amidohydrolase [Rhodonellum sp.]|uniref:amidohydrolase family protein n=1 Tax=Rhodonellum sp. TaxID=2231180 RepID=UPI0027286638|nr:amidohydrolase family protein [Rhodonellum sp.]MDO9553545.1 amidohydrolase family protein [Rhodonellum sp.]